ncbi:MAG: TGS domain-containing protein [Zavarzinella sp.]
MAVNLPPQYHDAEDEYRRARSPEEKLAALKKMWVILPKHKASEKVQAQLKSKISELSDDIDHARSTAKKSPTSYKIPRQGCGQILLLGGPNGGKSSLLRKLTKATPEVAAYPFTTREPVPGMMDFENVRLQLIEMPPITADLYEPYISDFTRTADAVALVLDLGDDDGPFAAETAVQELEKRKRLLVDQMPETEDDPTIYHVRALVIANKIDAEGAQDRLQMFQEIFPNRFQILEVSAEQGNMNALRAALYQRLGLIRVYGKQPGKQPDMTAPFTIPIGGTVLDFAEQVHTELAEKLKSAKVWGSAQFDGQTVKKDHVLSEGDVVELSV